MRLTDILPETKVFNACRALFGPRIEPSRIFLASLQPGEVKSAYRRRAKETHPDLFFGKDPWFQKRKSEQFQAVLESYNLVQEFFRQRDAPHRASSKYTAQHQKPEEKPHARTTNARPESKKAEAWPYDSPIPHLHLEIGRYLYYRGRIPYGALIKALSWQRSHRPSIGDIAVRWGWLNQHTVLRILNFRGPLRLFGERGVHLGIFSPFQVRTLLAFQRTRQKKIGQYFVEKNLLSHAEMERMVAEMKKHNAWINLPRVRV